MKSCVKNQIRNRIKRELSFAFRQSIPVLFGYLFLGVAFGLMLQSAGYSFIWASLASVFIYAGSGQFYLARALTAGAGLLSAAVMTLYINSRHIFYGLSFIEKFKAMGPRGRYMVFSLTDETYALLYSTSVPQELNESKVFFHIALLDQLYWIFGSTLGALIGQYVPFNKEGVEFAMTALFVVIFVEQWTASKSHLPALVGAVCGVVSFLIAGPDAFILPALIATAVFITLLKFVKPKAGRGEAQ